MKKSLFQEIKIPEGVEVEIVEGDIIVKGKEGELKKRFNTNRLIFEKKENKIIIGSEKSTKNEKKMMNTITAHIKNMFNGIQNKFEYKLKVCFSHFPFNVEIKGNEAIVKNFLGEKVSRKTALPQGIEIEVKKDIITITSKDKELAGQAAANLERVTRIRQRDKRIFQDGIYIISKNGKEM